MTYPYNSIDDEVEEDEDENEGEEDAEEEEEETPPPSPRKKYVNMTCYLCRSLIFHMHPDPRPRLSDVTRLLKNEDTKKRTSYTTTLQHLYWPMEQIDDASKLRHWDYDFISEESKDDGVSYIQNAMLASTLTSFARTPSAPRTLVKSPNNPFVVQSPTTPTPSRSIFEYVSKLFN